MVQSNQAFTAKEAVAIHVADGSATSLSDALNQLGLSTNPQVHLSEDIYEQIISALSNATLDGILFLVGVIAIVLDVFHPTIFTDDLRRNCYCRWLGWSGDNWCLTARYRHLGL